MERHRILASVDGQGGFMYPVVMMSSLIFLAIISHLMTMYTAEHHFTEERWAIFHMNRLKQMASYDVIQLLNKKNVSLKQGELRYNNGNVSFLVEPVEQQLYKVELDIILETDHAHSLYFLYDYGNKRIDRWVDLS